MPSIRGAAHHAAKLIEAQVVEIRSRHAAGDTLKSLHAAFPQCSKVNLHHIVTGKIWAHLLKVAS